MVLAKSQGLSASLEDYLEVIFKLTGESKTARNKDIAKSLGVSKPSVTGALRALKKKGLINYKPYGYITLTEDGEAAATEVLRRHNILKSFFINMLGVQADVASQAACKAEHTLGPEVITKLLCFIEFVARKSKDNYDLVGEFKQFCKNQRIK